MLLVNNRHIAGVCADKEPDNITNGHASDGAGDRYEWQNKQERDETKDLSVADSMPGEYVETPDAGPVSVVEAAEPETETEAA